MLAHCQLFEVHTTTIPTDVLNRLSKMSNPIYSPETESLEIDLITFREYLSSYTQDIPSSMVRATVGRSENNLDILRVFQNPGSCSVLNVWRYCQYPLDVNSTKHDGIKPLTDQIYEFHTDVYEILCHLLVPYLCMITSAFIFKFKNNEVSIMFCILYFFFLSIYITGSICIQCPKTQAIRRSL